MKHLFTLIFIAISIGCFGQTQKDSKQKLDSIKVLPFEDAQLKKYLTGDKAKEKAQLLERIAFMQREVQLIDEGQQVAIQTPLARENKQGQAIDFRNGYLIFKP